MILFSIIDNFELLLYYWCIKEGIFYLFVYLYYIMFFLLFETLMLHLGIYKSEQTCAKCIFDANFFVVVAISVSY